MLSWIEHSDGQETATKLLGGSEEALRLNQDDIAMAQALGFKPDALIKEHPRPQTEVEGAGEVLDS